MIVLTRSQTAAFHREALWELAHDALDHLIVELPGAWIERDEGEAVGELFVYVQRAMALGIDDRDAVMRFLEVLSLLDPAFGTRANDEETVDLLCSPEIAAEWPSSRDDLIALRDPDMAAAEETT